MKNILKNSRKLFKRDYRIPDYFYEFIRYLSNRYQHYYNFKDKYNLIDRAKNNENLLIILAKNRSFLWDFIFSRIYSNLKNNFDVIIVNPGDIHSKKLKLIAKDYEFSYLSTKSRKISSGLNIAIKLHQDAQWIYKIDDNIFLNKDFFKNLKKTYKNCKGEGIWNPGMVIPVININFCTYFYFLKTLNLIDEYQNKFGKIKFGLTSLKFRKNSEAAIWLWKKSLPLNSTAEIFNKQNNNKLEICPFRISINAILFKRDLWNQMGNYGIYGIAKGIKAGLPGELMADEISINEQILLYSIQQIIISLDTFVGHFGYPEQYAEMKRFFIKNQNQFKDEL